MAFGLLMKCGLTLTEWDRWQRLRGTDAKPDAARCFCSRDASSTLWRKKSALPRGRRSCSRSPLDVEATGPETWCLEVNLPFICPAGSLIISRNGVSLIYLKPSNCGVTTYAPAHHVSQSIHQDDTLSSRVPHTEALQVCHTVERHHGGPGSAVWHTTVWHSPVGLQPSHQKKMFASHISANYGQVKFVLFIRIISIFLQYRSLKLCVFELTLWGGEGDIGAVTRNKRCSSVPGFVRWGTA